MQQCAVQPPKSQSWTFLDGCLGVLAIAAACGAAYGAAQLTKSSWLIFGAFAVTMALTLAWIVNNQAKRHAREEEEYAAWLDRRIGATTSRTTRSQ